MKTIKFQGVDYLLVGDMIDGGAIATIEQYENGRCSFAHMTPDGRIMRFHVTIGHRDEVEVTGEYEPKMLVSVFDILTDPSWQRDETAC